MEGYYEEGVAISRDAQSKQGSEKQRSYVFSHLGEVSGLGLLGKQDEAEDAVRRLRIFQSDITLASIGEAIPMVESKGKQRLFEGLKLAGLG